MSLSLASARRRSHLHSSESRTMYSKYAVTEAHWVPIPYGIYQWDSHKRRIPPCELWALLRATHRTVQATWCDCLSSWSRVSVVCSRASAILSCLYRIRYVLVIQMAFGIKFRIAYGVCTYCTCIALPRYTHRSFFDTSHLYRTGDATSRKGTEGVARTWSEI